MAIHSHHLRWRYKNTTLLILSLLVFYFIADSDPIRNTIVSIGNLGYVGVFLTGILFVSVFTVAPAAVILFYFAETHDPFLVSLFAGLGGVVGDFIIFKFLKDRVFEELTPVFKKYGGPFLYKLFHTRHFHWMARVLGVAIIVSPFPDEVGIGFMGASKIKTWQFVLLTFILDTVGVYIITMFARFT